MKLFTKKSIKLVILDIMLPSTNGIQVIKEFRKTSTIPVLMLIALSDKRTQINSFDSLVDDYITKPFSFVLLGKRVLALLRRVGRIDEKDIWRHGDILVDYSGYLEYKDGKPIELAPKEIQLLKLLIENVGWVMREKC